MALAPAALCIILSLVLPRTGRICQSTMMIWITLFTSAGLRTHITITTLMHHKSYYQRVLDHLSKWNLDRRFARLVIQRMPKSTKNNRNSEHIAGCCRDCWVNLWTRRSAPQFVCVCCDRWRTFCRSASVSSSWPKGEKQRWICITRGDSLHAKQTYIEWNWLWRSWIAQILHLDPFKFVHNLNFRFIIPPYTKWRSRWPRHKLPNDRQGVGAHGPDSICPITLQCDVHISNCWTRSAIELSPAGVSRPMEWNRISNSSWEGIMQSNDAYSFSFRSVHQLSDDGGAIFRTSSLSVCRLEDCPHPFVLDALQAAPRKLPLSNMACWSFQRRTWISSFSDSTVVLFPFCLKGLVQTGEIGNKYE